MKKFNPLRIMLLAYLQAATDGGASRYDVMTNINLFFAKIDTAYSPGAFYHETKKLIAENMIEISHDKIAATPLAHSWLKEQMTSAPLPSSILGRVYYLSAAALLQTAEDRRIAIKRIEIDMINFDQKDQPSRQSMSALASVTNTWISQLNIAVRRVASELSDNI